MIRKSPKHKFEYSNSGERLQKSDKKRSKTSKKSKKSTENQQQKNQDQYYFINSDETSYKIHDKNSI